MTDRITREYATKERSFATETLKELGPNKAMNEETAGRLYLQARQRLDSLLAGRLMIIQAAHNFMSDLWLRTAAAVLICSIPVIIFVYERYWHRISHTPEITQNASPPPTTPPPNDIGPTEKALAALKELRGAVGKLPNATEKPKLDAKDARKLVESAAFHDGRFATIGNFIFSLSTESNPPPEATQLSESVGRSQEPISL